MKILMSLIALLMFNKECDSKKIATDSKSQDLVEEIISNQQEQEQMTVIYEALSRGFFQKISVSKDGLIVSNDRNLIEKTKYSCSKEDWNTIMTLLKEVDLKALPTLEAPTSKRLYDGAAHASLSINSNDEIFQSNGFDHGHPPQAIEKLVNKMLSMSENAQKQ